MPKAVSSHPSLSPTKSSPMKPSYHRNIAGDFSVPLGSSRSSLSSSLRTDPARAAASRPCDRNYGTAANGRRILVFHNLPSKTSGTKDEPIWLADDIFTTPKTSRVVTTEPKFESQPPQANAEADGEFPRMIDVERALDEATVNKGLVSHNPNSL